MKYIIIAFCIALIIFAFYMLIKNIILQTKGRCTGKCNGCSKSSCCELKNKIK